MYYIVSKNKDTRQVRIITSFERGQIDQARKFIEDTNYFIAFDMDAMLENGYMPSKSAVDKDVTERLKVSDNPDDIWYTTYSMHRGEGCNHNTACKMADDAVKGMARVEGNVVHLEH